MPATDSGPSTHRLGRYHLSECLGGGPTGEVYRAKVYGIAGMDRDFAVKRFHPTFVTGSAAAAEIAVAAQLYGSLDHPKIAKLQELGVSGDHTFTAVEFVVGVDLAQLIDHGKLPLGAAAKLVVQICRTIGYAHSRGIRHLGIAPTNVICSERGEIKVTDFGFLPPRLPRRPAEDASLQPRLCYLAPEQLEGEECTPATDVYQLGTMAFELMVGRKPYAGRSGMALAQQMLTGVTPESGLAAPYQKLLKRALSRSPFERFPDAGAMADAIEAALRSSPAEGSLLDVGNAVSEREVFLAGSRESQASGALSFPIPAPPMEARSAALDIRTPPPVPGSAVSASPKEPPTVVGTSKHEEDESEDTEIDFLQDTTDVKLGAAGEPERDDTIPTMEAPHIPEGERDASGLLLGPAGTNASATRAQFIGGETQSPDPKKTLLGGMQAYTPPPPVPSSARAKLPEADAEELQELSAEDFQEVDPSDVQVPMGAAPLPPNPASTFPPPLADHNLTPPPMEPDAKPSGLSPVIKYPLMAVAIGAVAFLTFTLLASDDNKGEAHSSKGVVAAVPGHDAAPAAIVFDAKTATPTVALSFDASTPEAVDFDAAAAEAIKNEEVVDAAPAEVVTPTVDPDPVPTPTGSGGLQVGSSPEGAKVYLDGSLVGNTPLQLDASADKHRLALVLPGYALYTGDIDGEGFFNIDLNEVTPPEGPGGIKVRCKKNPNRYYVFLDGKAVGQLCPTERLGVSKGKHVVEIYDPVTDSRREFNVKVEDTRLSVRIRID